MKKLSVPHPGHFEALKEIISHSKDEVYEIYMPGSPDYIGSVRRISENTPTIQDIEEQTDYAHDHGIRMDILMNSACFGGSHLTQAGSNMHRWYLGKLDEIGVDSVTVADPYLVELISNEFDMEAVISVVAYADSPEKAVFYEEMGAGTITLDTNINRHFELLKGIRDSTSCKLKVMVNEGCLYRCPFRYSHFNLTSHYGPDKPNTLSDYYHDKCISMKARNPELIMKSGWVRPEDMKEYESIGIDLFKIAGRIQPVNWIIDCMNAYIERSYHGNLMDILDGTGLLRDLFYIPNGELEGAIEEWKTCDKVCYRCNFCKELTKRIVKVYRGVGTENSEMIPFSSVCDGSF